MTDINVMYLALVTAINVGVLVYILTKQAGMESKITLLVDREIEARLRIDRHAVAINKEIIRNDAIERRADSAHERADNAELRADSSEDRERGWSKHQDHQDHHEENKGKHQDHE